MYAGFYMRFYSSSYDLEEIYLYYPLMPKAFAFALIIVIISFYTNLYSGDKRIGREEILTKIIISRFFAACSLAALYYFVPSLFMGRGILLYAIFLSVVFQAAWHIGYDFLQELPVGIKRVLILGTGPAAQTMGQIIHGNNNGFNLSGYINCRNEPVQVPEERVIGDGDGLFAIALKEKVQKIIVSLSERRGSFPTREILDCKLNGIEIVDGPLFYEQMTGKLFVENMNPSHLIFSDGFRITIGRRFVKRVFDLVLVSAGALFSIPFWLIIPALIKLESRGPVLFKQERVGEGEKIFYVCKFRTMIDGAEDDTGPVWSQTGDSRITRIGRILRKWRLDEIPQLYNVLRGDMSFIGPRPERPFFVENLKNQIPYYSERHCIKPGVTGWAQVRYEYGDSKEDALEKLSYDLYFIKYQTLLLDLLIILDTVKVVLSGRGGR
jgi:sugar transferase (PEP-CTERM system associated)